jgi:hypothetical protein
LAASTADWIVVYEPACPWNVPTSSTFPLAVAAVVELDDEDEPQAASSPAPRTQATIPSAGRRSLPPPIRLPI